MCSSDLGITMAVSKRKERNTWQYAFGYEGKTYRKSGFKTKREATEAETKARAELSEGMQFDNNDFYSQILLFISSISILTLKHKKKRTAQPSNPQIWMDIIHYSHFNYNLTYSSPQLTYAMIRRCYTVPRSNRKIVSFTLPII